MTKMKQKRKLFSKTKIWLLEKKYEKNLMQIISKPEIEYKLKLHSKIVIIKIKIK